VRRVLVFVYGTLMRGHANHRVMDRLRARFVAPARTVARRTLVDLGPYPALLREGGACRVTGEVFEVAEARLAELDEFEGCPDLYARETVEIERLDDGSTLEAFVYVLARNPPTRARLVEGGAYAGGGVLLHKDAREAADAAQPRAHVCRNEHPMDRSASATSSGAAKLSPCSVETHGSKRRRGGNT
jgi:gamma-glutamylaminecyclotransferase